MKTHQATGNQSIINRLPCVSICLSSHANTSVNIHLVEFYICFSSYFYYFFTDILMDANATNETSLARQKATIFALMLINFAFRVEQSVSIYIHCKQLSCFEWYECFKDKWRLWSLYLASFYSILMLHSN